jgi:hypothetical protein
MLEQILTLLNVKVLALKTMAYEGHLEDGSHKVIAEVQVLHILKCGRLALHKSRNELLICIKLHQVIHHLFD